MKNNTASKTNDLPSNATIVDGKLILSLPNALMPVVWQMDLERAQSAAFTVQEDKKKKSFALVLKDQDGSIDEIAEFGDKQTAVDVLMETSGVLQNAHGKIRPATTVVASNSNASPVAPSSVQISNNDKTGALLALALIIVLGLIWMMSATGKIRTQDSVSTTSTSSSTTSTDARGSSGVPISADDFLSNR